MVSGLIVTAALLCGPSSRPWAIRRLNLTLDLSGVTGLIVSVGITVDSYIVYFERLKDEARSGRSVRTSVDQSFQGAFRTVLAADLVSLAAALVLYLLGGRARCEGFAFFLGLSTLLDVFTTFFFTRPLVILLGRNTKLTEARVIGIARGLAIGSESHRDVTDRHRRSRGPRPSGPTPSSGSTGARPSSTSSAGAGVVPGLGHRHRGRASCRSGYEGLQLRASTSRAGTSWEIPANGATVHQSRCRERRRRARAPPSRSWARGGGHGPGRGRPDQGVGRAADHASRQR